MNQQNSVTATPPAEVQITKKLVQQLLKSQHSDLSDLPINLLDEGWDNVMFRLGKEFVIRMPRRKVAVKLLQNEQKWLPNIAKKLPIPTPVSLKIGKPEFDFPWTWSILPWLEGKTANFNYPQTNEAERFANFLKVLHQPAPENAPKNTSRGIPLKTKAEAVEGYLSRLKSNTNFITPKIETIWETALKAKRSTEICWLHGDLHARNVLINNGKFSGIIDWGDLTSGDVATDLASIWMLFETQEARKNVIEVYGFSEDLLARAKGWAVFFGVILLETGLVDNPQHAEMGRITLERLEEDF